MIAKVYTKETMKEQELNPPSPSLIYQNSRISMLI